MKLLKNVVRNGKAENMPRWSTEISNDQSETFYIFSFRKENVIFNQRNKTWILYCYKKCFSVLDRVMDACERWEHWKARIMLFSCLSNFSRAFITTLRTSNHEPCLQWDTCCVLGLFSDVVVICRTSLVFLSSFKTCLVLRALEQLLVILLCFTVYPSFFVEIVR